MRQRRILASRMDLVVAALIAAMLLLGLVLVGGAGTPPRPKVGAAHPRWVDTEGVHRAVESPPSTGAPDARVADTPSDPRRRARALAAGDVSAEP